MGAHLEYNGDERTTILISGVAEEGPGIMRLGKAVSSRLGIFSRRLTRLWRTITSKESRKKGDRVL